jgi:hypothetical protein
MGDGRTLEDTVRLDSWIIDTPLRGHIVGPFTSLLPGQFDGVDVPDGG